MPRSIVEIERLPLRRTIFVPNIPKGAGVGIIWCTSLVKTGYNWNQDSHLTFTEHLSTLASSLLSSLSQISRVRHLFTKDGLKIILKSLIFRKLFYCWTVWSATFKQNIKKLQLMQNFAARILTDIRKYDHICPILHELDWLTVKVLLRLPVQDTTMIYKCYLQSAQKRTSKNPRNRNQLSLSKRRTEIAQRSFFYSTLPFWRHFFAKHKILPNLVIRNWLWWTKRVLLANHNRGNILKEK